MGIPVEGLPDGAHRIGTGIHPLGRAVGVGGDEPRPEGHLAVGQGGTVLHHQHPLPRNPVGIIHQQGRLRRHDLGFGRMGPDVLPHLGHPVGRGRIHLVDDGDVGHDHVGLAGVIPEFVTGPVGIEQDNVEIRMVKRRVVVAAVPDDNVGLFFSGLQDLAVVDAGIDHDAALHQGFVLLPLLDGAAVGIEIGKIGEPLDDLLGEIAVGHGVARHHRRFAAVPNDPADLPGGLGFPAPGPHRADRHGRLFGLEHGVGGPQQDEISAPGHGDGPLVHHLGMGHVGIGESHQIGLVFPDEVGQSRLFVNGNAVGISLPGQFRRIPAALDVRDLGGGKGDHPVAGIVAEIDVEIVEIPPRRAHDDGVFDHFGAPLSSQAAAFRVGITSMW